MTLALSRQVYVYVFTRVCYSVFPVYGACLMINVIVFISVWNAETKQQHPHTCMNLCLCVCACVSVAGPVAHVVQTWIPAAECFLRTYLHDCVYALYICQCVCVCLVSVCVLGCVMDSPKSTSEGG